MKAPRPKLPAGSVIDVYVWEYHDEAKPHDHYRSIDGQEAAAHAVAEAREWTVRTVWRDASAQHDFAGRPAFHAMLSDLKETPADSRPDAIMIVTAEGTSKQERVDVRNALGLLGSELGVWPVAGPDLDALHLVAAIYSR